MGIDYKTAGVDTEAGDHLVDWLQSSKTAMPFQDRIVSGIGGFASLFNIQFPEIKKPLLITCTDGVGTKVKLASHFKDYSTIGQDLVAMCVNDLICTGGRPLMFLDYYATGKLDLSAAKPFLESVRKACAESECALVGGETAEMPGVYQDNDFDCAGFAVGLVDQDHTWGPHKVKATDRLIGVASSGFHSNGYSLLRKIFADDLNEYKQQLLTPTALYVKLALGLQKLVDVHAGAHITGGGIENIPRVIPKDLAVVIPKVWEFPSIYNEVRKRTKISDFELLKTLNCGIGFVFVVSEKDADKTLSYVNANGLRAFDLGYVVERNSDVLLTVQGLGELCEPRS